MEAMSPRDAVEQMCKGINDHDVDKAMRYYEDGAIFIHPADGTIFRGAGEVRKALSALIELRPTLVTHRYRKEIENGDIAFVSADHSLTGKAPDGSPVTIDGTTTDVLRRQSDGTWKFLIDNPGGIA
jgi:ketosteroid isomerase-like protein